MNFRPGFQQMPPLVKNLLIINVLVFLLQNYFETTGAAIMGKSFDALFALHYWQFQDFRWWQMITYMFMHGDIMHIFFNMLALWMFGSVLENNWGSERFAIFYFVCGLGAALCQMGVQAIQFNHFFNEFLAYQQNPSPSAFSQFLRAHGLSGDPNYIWTRESSIASLKDFYDNRLMSASTMGASGAVYGLLFAFGYLFPNTEMLVFPIPMPVKAKWMVAGYMVIELTQGLRNNPTDNVAHFAHLGGALFAFILLRIWGRRIRNNFY